MAQDSDTGRGSGRSKGDFKGGGLRLPGLKAWRVRRGLTQAQLAQLVGVPTNYVQRIEQGKRGCNPWVAQKMAEVLEVDLGVLGAGFAPEEEDTGAERAVGRVRRGRPPAAGPRRSLHRAYLGVLLEREVGSAYSALDESQFESRCVRLSLDDLLEGIAARGRERGFLKEMLNHPERLHPEVRAFLEELLREQPDEDIRILAARRRQVHSEEGRERLTRAMRELLLV